MNMVKLFLICHPKERKAFAIAAMLGCSERTVRKAMRELNITPIKRPKDCIG
jgi:transcriptional antiterminator